MGCCINDLRDKDVININDGKRLGCVSNVDIDVCSGKLMAIMVPGECKGIFFSKSDELRIPWERIVRIGSDTILVDLRQRGGEAVKVEM